MLLQHVFGIMTRPTTEWQRIKDSDCSVQRCLWSHIVWLALIPPICGYIGTTQIGWTIGSRAPTFLSNYSAGIMAVAYFGAVIVGILGMGAMVQWMTRTYGVEQPFRRCLALAAYTITPMLLIGVFYLYPQLWVNLLIGLPALGYVVYLLYTGVPILMDINQEKGFLMSSAILAVGMVGLVAMLALTVVFWGIAIGPEFVS